MSKSFIVLGKNGQLGRSFTRSLENTSGCELRAAYGHSELDISDESSLAAGADSISEDPPDWILNAAAFTAVDRCESETEACTAANGTGPGRLAEICAGKGIALVHLSTDYVFAGDSKHPYREEDPTGPRTAYGQSKLIGEERVLSSGARSWVVRTSWVFGRGKNFVGAIVRQAILRELGRVEGPLKVVDDQLGCPTYSDDLAEAIVSLTSATDASGKRGLIHLSNSEPCTWWDFARAILDGAGYSHLEIDRVKTSEFVTPAPRPAYSVLDCGKAESLGVKLRSWRDALAAYLETSDFETRHAEARAEVEAAS
jgi:dTDP-4-dehydrorhamnose reductase